MYRSRFASPHLSLRGLVTLPPFGPATQWRGVTRPLEREVKRARNEWHGGCRVGRGAPVAPCDTSSDPASLPAPSMPPYHFSLLSFTGGTGRESGGTRHATREGLRCRLLPYPSP